MDMQYIRSTLTFTFHIAPLCTLVCYAELVPFLQYQFLSFSFIILVITIMWTLGQVYLVLFQLGELLDLDFL